MPSSIPSLVRGCLKALGKIQLLSTYFHPQIDGQRERVIKILDNMLKIDIMYQKSKWEEYLPLVEFTYNNGQQESMKMSPFEALYEKSCNAPINWTDLVNRVSIATNMLVEMEQEIHAIKRNFNATQDKKNSYVDKHTEFKDFYVGDNV